MSVSDRIGRWTILLCSLAACRDGGLIANGTLEVRETDVAALVPARVVAVRVEEGDKVHRGDTLVTLLQATTRTDVDQRAARVRAAEAALRDLRAGSRPAEVRAAEAEVSGASAEASRTAREAERSRALARDGVISEQALEAAQTAATAAASRRDRAAEALRLVRQGPRSEQVRAAEAEVAGARAALAGAEAQASDLVLTAPVDGVVLARYVEPGEILGAALPAVTVGEMARPRARVYLAATDVPAVRVGQSVTATLDGLPDRAFTGRVRSVSDRAEFTPRIALTAEERSDLLFGVELVFDDTTGALKPGLPVTVHFTEPR